MCNMSRCSYKAEKVARMPLQRDSTSCGIFVAKTAECLSIGKPVFFCQKTAELMRNRIALDLYRAFIPL